MDHVINNLRQWLEIYEEETGADRDEKAIVCIKKAIKELQKYYSKKY